MAITLLTLLGVIGLAGFTGIGVRRDMVIMRLMHFRIILPIPRESLRDRLFKGLLVPKRRVSAEVEGA